MQGEKTASLSGEDPGIYVFAACTLMDCNPIPYVSRSYVDQACNSQCAIQYSTLLDQARSTAWNAIIGMPTGRNTKSAVDSSATSDHRCRYLHSSVLTSIRHTGSHTGAVCLLTLHVTADGMPTRCSAISALWFPRRISSIMILSAIRVSYHQQGPVDRPEQLVSNMDDLL